MSPSLASCPTPVFRTSGLEVRDAELWIKNDGLTHPLYGGNKVRKLGPLLDRAQSRGVRRLVTAGGAGSHHVLATTLFARQNDIRTAAALCPQPWTEHAEKTLRCSLAWGLEAIPVDCMAAIPMAVHDNWHSGDLVVPVGGWGLVTSRGYVEAVEELNRQIADGELPPPDLIVVALGSGGTAAGLLAGLATSELKTRLVATSVAIRNPWLARQVVLPLAWRLARESGQRIDYRALKSRLVVDTSRLGPGYGEATEETELAISVAKNLGVNLDQTYTAKTFATVLDLVGHLDRVGRPTLNSLQESLRNTWKQRPLRVLYWHTLAATPLEPLLAEGPADPALPERLRMLLQGG